MSLFTDLKEVFTAYAQRIKSLAAAGEQIQADLGDLNALIAPPRLDDNTNLDSVITSGVYTLYANLSYLNKPTQDAEHGILEVWKEKYGVNGDTGRTFQRLTYTYKAGRTNSEIWVRSKSGLTGSTWTPWVSVSNMSINDVENLLQEKTGLITKIEGGYINLTTDPVSLTPVEDALWSHSIVNCAEGDTFIINADGGQRPRAWGFLDSSNHVLSVADASTVVEGLQLTAPTNAVKLIINDRSGATSYIVGNNLASNKIDIQQNPVDFGKALIINRDGQVRPGVVSGGSGLTDDVRVALLACFRHVLWDDEHANEYYNALEVSLYAVESKLTAVIDYGNAILFTDDPLSKVKWMMKVYYDGVEVPVQNYTLTGNMIAGQNVLTITYNNDSTSILVEAEEKPASRLVLTSGDLVKFDGIIMSSTTDGHIPPYLVSNAQVRAYYVTKGHMPYRDANNNVLSGKYPIPIPADATHVRVAVAPNSYELSVYCWKYNNSIKTYTSLVWSGLVTHIAEFDIPQFEGNARALSIAIQKPDVTDFDASTEPTQVVVQFT